MPKLDLDAIPQVNATGYPPPFDEAVRGHEEHAIAHVGERDRAIRVGHGAGRRLGAIDLDG